MRFRGVVAAAAWLVPVLFSDLVQAQEWNALVVTSGGVTQQPDAEGDSDVTLTTNLVPSLALTWEKGNATHRLAYTLTLTFFPDAESDTSAISNTAGWQTAWQSGPVSTWLFDLGVAHTQNAALTLITEPGAGPNSGVTALPTQTLTLSAGEGYARELGPRWRFTQGLVGSYLTPVGDNAQATIGDTSQATFALGLDRTLRRGNFGVAALAGVVTAEVTDAGGMQQLQETGTATLLARYSRELSLRWSAEAFAGSSLVLRLDTDQGAFAPTFGLAATWLGDVGQGNASASRTTTFNPFLAQTLLTDMVLVSFARPLARSPVLVATTLSYAHSRTLVANRAMEDENLDTFTGDVSVGYELSEFSALAFRYQYVYIDSDSELFADGSRHSALLTYTARWPREQRTVMPVRQPLRMLRAPQIQEPGSGGGRPRPPNAL